MRPAARIQAAIELLEGIIAAARDGGPAADTLIARYFAERRYAGSKDRRAVRDLVYAAIRHAGDRPQSGRAAMVALAREDADLAALFDGSAHAPAPLTPNEPAASAGAAPAWLAERLQRSAISSADLAALGDRAPLDVRVNALLATVGDMAAAIPGAVALTHAPQGLRLPTGTNVDHLPAWNSGRIEVQDEGSQVVVAAVPVAPGSRIVDLCAGAGGKSLALAAAMANQGAVLACDIDRGRLSRLAPRATRAGVSIIDTRLLNPGRETEMLADWAGSADAVVIDAPCSGTGTWRRNPEARWRLSPDRLDRLRETQRRVFDIGAGLVRPGGAMIYIVCSLLDEEGADQVDTFLAQRQDWTAEAMALPAGTSRGAGIRLTPAADGTDGFFVARLSAPC